MKLKIIEAFNWAHRNVEIKEYVVGDPDIETDDADLIEVSMHEGWTVDAGAPVDTDGAPKKRSKAAAPENKALPGAPEDN